MELTGRVALITGGKRIGAAVAAEPAAGQWVTMSFGVSGSAGPDLERERLLNESDAALYEAKGAGRNRVVCAPPQKTRAGRRAARPAQTQVATA